MTSTTGFPTQTIRTDEANPFEEFFGPPPYKSRIDVNEYAIVDRYDLPAAYIGKNRYLAELIEGFIVNQTDVDFTSVVLPIVKTDDLSISFNKWVFEPALLERVPVEGTSRLVRSSKSQHSDKMVRYGIGFIAEHGFMTTAEGRAHYINTIRQIVQATQLTMSFDALNAILRARRYDIQWLAERGFFNQRLPEILKDEINMFGILQKDPNGFDVAVETHKKRMSRYAVQPDALLLPEKCSIYIPMGNPEKFLYSNRGNTGVDAFEKGAITSFRGIRVFDVHSYDVYENELPIDLCSSVEQIGQFNVMHFNEHADPSMYKSHHRDILVYDANSDNFERISFLDALKHSMRFKGDGSLDTDAYPKNRKSFADDVFIRVSETDDDDDEHKPSGFSLCKNFADIDADKLTLKQIKFVIGTVMNHLSDEDKANLEAGHRWIVSKRASEAPDKVFASTLALVKSSNDPVAKKFLESIEILSDLLSKIFPQSALFSVEGGDDAAVAAEADREYKAPVEAVMTNMYDGGVSSPDRVEVAVQSDDVSINAASAAALDIGAQHEMNIRAMSTASADHAKHYTEAAAKYDVSSPMYKRIVHDTSRLIKKHIDDLNSAEVNAKVKLMSKMSGNVAADEKILSRMMPADASSAAAAAAAPVAMTWKLTPYKWTSACEGNENMRRYSKSGVSSDAAASRSVGFSRRVFGDDDADDDVNAEIGARMTTSANHEAVKNISSIAEALVGMAFLKSPISLQTLQSMVHHDVAVPFDIVVARPFITFEMLHGALMKAGTQTGMTLVGHSDFLLSDDGRSKLHLGNFTMYAKAMIVDAKNITLLKNIYINDYRGGMSTSFWTGDHADMDKREMCFHEGANRHSIFSMLVHCDALKHKGNPIDLRDVSSYYAEKLRFDTLAEPTYADQMFEPNEVNVGNPICYRGMSYEWNPETKNFSKIVVGTGHLGKDIYVGLASVWSGGNKYVEKQSYQLSF